MAIHIGNYLGKFVKFDPKSFDGFWKACLRIRVLVDITKPLKPRMRIKKLGSDWNILRFKYERLPNFCFYCGIIGHSDKFCELKFEANSDQRDLKFDISIRATMKLILSKPGERWLSNPMGLGKSTASNQTTDMGVEENEGQQVGGGMKVRENQENNDNINANMDNIEKRKQIIVSKEKEDLMVGTRTMSKQFIVQKAEKNFTALLKSMEARSTGNTDDMEVVSELKRKRVEKGSFTSLSSCNEIASGHFFIARGGFCYGADPA